MKEFKQIYSTICYLQYRVLISKYSRTLQGNSEIEIHWELLTAPTAKRGVGHPPSKVNQKTGVAGNTKPQASKGPDCGEALCQSTILQLVSTG